MYSFITGKQTGHQAWSDLQLENFIRDTLPSLCPSVCSENVIPRLLCLVNARCLSEWTQHLKEGEGGCAFSFFLPFRVQQTFSRSYSDQTKTGREMWLQCLPQISGRIGGLCTMTFMEDGWQGHLGQLARMKIPVCQQLLCNPGLMTNKGAIMIRLQMNLKSNGIKFIYYIQL